MPIGKPWQSAYSETIYETTQSQKNVFLIFGVRMTFLGSCCDRSAISTRAHADSFYWALS